MSLIPLYFAHIWMNCVHFVVSLSVTKRWRDRKCILTIKWKQTAFVLVIAMHFIGFRTLYISNVNCIFLPQNGKTISFYTTTNSDLFACLFACMFTTNSTMLFYCTCFTNKLRLKMYAVGFLALVVASLLFIDIDILPLFSYATFQRVFARKSSNFQ